MKTLKIARDVILKEFTVPVCLDVGRRLQHSGCHSLGSYWVSRPFTEGESCDKNGVRGVCRNVRQCQSAIDDIRNRRGPPKLCSFSSTDPIICCLDVTPTTTSRAPFQTTRRTPPTTTRTTSTRTSTSRTSTSRTTTEYVPEEEVFVLNVPGSESNDECEPISPNDTAPKNGQKAWDKCVEYQHKLIFPCGRGVILTGGLSRGKKCHHDANQLVVGGNDTTKDEFPHMVLLGYGEDVNDLQWLCGGSLISERFILTAAHCTPGRNVGPVTYARVGALRRTDSFSSEQLYAVSDIIKHPQYNSPQQYHDIALLKTDRDVVLDEFTVPACLDVSAPGDYSRVLATGWGATQNRGKSADHLQKVILKKFMTPECFKMFPPSRYLKEGFDHNTQICYGDKDMSKDTCQGDSGGPIQLKSQLLHCMYTVIGVTSFGRACGRIGKPGIYTRVAEYVPWIESVVWP